MLKKSFLILATALLVTLIFNPININEFNFVADPAYTAKKYGTEISSKELNQIIIDKLHFNKTYIRGDSYWLPTKDWIFTSADLNFELFLIEYDLKYQYKFNCVDYSRLFESMSQIEYINSKPNEIMQCVAVGEVHYMPDPSKVPPKYRHVGHSINIVVLKDGNIMFVEPQSGLETFLSATELSSICYISF